MHIETRSISQIDAASYNPRIDLQPGDPDYEKLRHSIEEFGCVEPLVWNRRSGHLVGGHQRFKVLAASGAKYVDVSVVDLPPEKEKALNLALNRIQGDWDEGRLAELIQELTELPEFDVSLTGFDPPEISSLLDRITAENEEGEDDFDLADALDASADTAPITQSGDLLELGPHRLLCGDAAKDEDLQRLLAGAKADLLFTDPPYNVNYYGGHRPTPAKARPKPSHQWKHIYQDDLSQPDYEAWLEGILANALESLAPGAPFYLWNSHLQFGPMQAMLTRLEAHVSCAITWAKENFAIGYGDYNQQTEFCLYGWRADGNSHRWYGPTNESTLWSISRDCTRSYRHPTQKPNALAERALRNSTTRGEIVLDCFLGSGSTLVAADRLGRRCFGIEIDPRYCDAIVRRYIAIAGGDGAAQELLDRYGQENQS